MSVPLFLSFSFNLVNIIVITTAKQTQSYYSSVTSALENNNYLDYIARNFFLKIDINIMPYFINRSCLFEFEL